MRKKSLRDQMDETLTILTIIAALLCGIFLVLWTDSCAPAAHGQGITDFQWPSPEDPNFIEWFMAADPNVREGFMAWYRSSPDYNTQPEEPNEPARPPRISTPEQWEIECLGLMVQSGQWLQEEKIVDEMNSVFAPVNFDLPANEILKWVKFQERKAVLTLTIDNWGIARLNLKKIAMLSEDLDGDGHVDLNDLAVKSRNWMKEN